MARGGRPELTSPLRRAPEQRVLNAPRVPFVTAPSVADPGRNARDLANALSSFSDALGGLRSRMSKDEEAAAAERQKMLEAEIRASPEHRARELIEEWKADPSGLSAVERAKVESLHGELEGKRAMAEAIHAMKNGGYVPGRETVTPGEWARAYAISKAEERSKGVDSTNIYGQWRYGLNKAMADLQPKLEKEELEFRTEKGKEIKRQIVHTSIENALVQGQMGPYQNDQHRIVGNLELMNATRELLVQQVAGSDGFVGSIEKKEVDKAIVDAAKRVANGGDPGLALGFMMQPRQDPNTGQILPPLGATPEYADTMERIKTQVAEDITKKQKAALDGRVGTLSYETLKQGGRLTDLEDTKVNLQDGSTVTVTREKQIELGMREYDRYNAEESAKEGNSEVSAVRMADELTRMGLPSPQMATALTNLPATYGPEMRASLQKRNQTEVAGEAPILSKLMDPRKEDLKAKADFVTTMARVNPVLLNQHFKTKESKKFWDMYIARRTYYGEEGFEQSLDFAAKQMSKAPEEMTKPGQVHASDVWKRVSKSAISDYMNSGEVLREIERDAIVLMDSDLDAGRAVAAAAERLNTRGVKIGDRWVPIPIKNGEPIMKVEEFKKYGKEWVDYWYEANIAGTPQAADIPRESLSLEQDPRTHDLVVVQVLPRGITRPVVPEYNDHNEYFTGTVTPTALMQFKKHVESGAAKKQFYIDAEATKRQQAITDAFRSQDWSKFAKEEIEKGIPGGSSAGLAWKLLYEAQLPANFKNSLRQLQNLGHYKDEKGEWHLFDDTSKAPKGAEKMGVLPKFNKKLYRNMTEDEKKLHRANQALFGSKGKSGKKAREALKEAEKSTRKQK